MSKLIPLSNGRAYAIVDDEDYDFISSLKWNLTTHGYAENYKYGILMHRIINNTPKNKVTDHINRNKLDNRKINLRSATKRLNAYNVPKLKNNTSGYKGVSFHKATNKWQSRILYKGKSIYLGIYNTPREAYEVYKIKAKELQGEFACETN